MERVVFALKSALGGDVPACGERQAEAGAPSRRFAGTDSSIFLGGGRPSSAMILSNASAEMPVCRRGLCAFSSPMVVTVRPL